MKVNEPKKAPCCEATYKDIPKHQRISYILSGYRIHFTSIDQCVRSMFNLHNETINIWTHFLAGWWFLYEAVTFTLSITKWNLEDMVVLAALCSAVWCMFVSAWFHTCLCLPCPNTFNCLLKADMAGILLVIFTLYVGGVCLLFGGKRAMLQGLYFLYALLGGILGSLPLTVTHLTKWGQISLLVFAASSVVPFSHFAAIATAEEIEAFGLPVVGFALNFGIAIVIFFGVLPERLSPGRFDIWFHSHQWWHILVFGGIECALWGLQNLHALRARHALLE